MTISSEILNHPDLGQYRMQIPMGKNLFLEGDSTIDIYIMISGRLGVFKGSKQLADIHGEGVFIGEMSHLLNNRRSATVQAMEDTHLLKIPAGEIDDVKCRFPQISMAMSRLLAERLHKADQVLFGHQSLCDSLPDAVFMTDRDGMIISCNQAAESLYGKTTAQLVNSPAAHLCTKPEIWPQLVERATENRILREQKIAIHHPKETLRTISASMTALYDTHNNMQGTLLLARDVTRHERMLKTHRTFRWLTVVGSAILFVMLAALLLGYPYFATAYREKNSNVAQIEKNIAKDLIYFKTLLGKHVATGDVTHLQTFSEFLNRQPNKSPLYTGIVLLNQFKHVVHVSRANFAIDEPDIPLGSSYTDIDFQSVKESDHFLLSLYRTSTAHPMGRKGIEVAFGLNGREKGIKWLVLQLNADLLVTVFKIKDADLLDMRLVYP